MRHKAMTIDEKACAFIHRHSLPVVGAADREAVWSELWARDEPPARYRHLRRLWATIERRHRADLCGQTASMTEYATIGIHERHATPCSHWFYLFPAGNGTFESCPIKPEESQTLRSHQLWQEATAKWEEAKRTGERI